MIWTLRDSERTNINRNRQSTRKVIFIQLITLKLIGYLITTREVKVNVDNQMEYHSVQKILIIQQDQMITDQVSNKRLSELLGNVREFAPLTQNVVLSTSTFLIQELLTTVGSGPKITISLTDLIRHIALSRKT